MLVSFFKSRFYDLPAYKLKDCNVTISHRPRSSLMRKGVHRRGGGLNHPSYRSDIYHSKYRFIAQNTQAPSLLSYLYEIFNYSK